MKVTYIKTNQDHRCTSGFREIELMTITQNDSIQLPMIGDVVYLVGFHGEVWFRRWNILEKTVSILLK